MDQRYLELTRDCRAVGLHQGNSSQHEYSIVITTLLKEYSVRGRNIPFHTITPYIHTPYIHALAETTAIFKLGLHLDLKQTTVKLLIF